MIQEKAFYRHKDLPELVVEVLEVSKYYVYVVEKELRGVVPRAYERAYFERFYELDG